MVMIMTAMNRETIDWGVYSKGKLEAIKAWLGEEVLI